MDKIILKGLSFYGYHGVLAEENRLGQKFIIDIELYLDLKASGHSDDIEKTVSYADVYKTVEQIVTGESFKLVEALAETMCHKIFEQFSKIDGIKVKIEKPEAPIPGNFDYFGVEILRGRDGKSLY